MVPSWLAPSVWTLNRRDSAAANRGLLGGVGVEHRLSLVDEPGEGDEPDLAGDRGQPTVDVGGAVEGELVGELRESPCLPERHLAGLHECPGPLEPMGQLERIGHQAAGGVGGDAQCGAELHRGELRNLRSALPGEGDHELPPEDRARLHRLRGMQVGPRQRGPYDVDLGRVGVGPSLLREGEHGGGGAAVGEFGGGHASV